MSQEQKTIRILILTIFTCAVWGAATLFFEQSAEASSSIRSTQEHASSVRADATVEDPREGPRNSGAVPAGAALGPWGARAGSRFQYSIDSRSKFRLVDESRPDGGESGGEAGALHYTGTLHWMIHERTKDALLTSVHASGLTFKGVEKNAEGIPERIEALRAPVFLLMNLDGSVRSIAFGRKLRQDVADFVRSVAANLGYRLGTGDGAYRSEKTWECEESDATGRFRGTYRVVDVAKRDAQSTYAVARRKEAYTRVNSSVGDVPKHKLGGECKLRIDRSFAWLESVHAEESTRMKMPGMDASFEISTVTRVRLEGQSEVPVRERRSLASFDAADFEPAGAEDAAVEYDAEARLAALKRKLEGKTLHDILGAMLDAHRIHGDQSHEAYTSWAALGHYLEVHPEACAEILRMLQSGEGDEGTARLLTSALGAAGNSEAQAALLAMMDDPNLKVEMRDDAIVASHQLAEPAPRFLEALEKKVAQFGDFDSTKSSSVLALGTLSARNSAKLSNGRNPLESLLAHEGRASREGWLAVWLESLGNTGSPRVFDAVARYITHSSSEVRGAAVRVLPRIPDTRAVSVLIARQAAESDAGVRGHIADALSNCPRGAADECLRRMVADRSLDVGKRALAGLGARFDSAENLAFVEAIARDATSAELRAFAQGLLDEHRKSPQR